MRICINEPFWYLKDVASYLAMVLLHTLSAYNNLFVRHKVYSTDPSEYLCTSWRYAEAYENFSIDASTMLKKSYKNKNKIVILNCQPLLLGKNYTEIKVWQLKCT